MESGSSDGRGSWDWRMPVAVCLVVVSTVVVYGRVCGHEFAGWDDHMTIYHNPLLDPPSGENIAKTWRGPEKGLYVPVTYSYWGLLARVARVPDAGGRDVHLDPRVFHAGSLVLHAAAGLLVLGILRLLTGNVWGALAGALVFVLHPVQVETVAWASGAKDLLSGVLALCAIHQYVMFARSGDGRGRWRHYGVGAGVLVLAMLAKPSAMVVPAVVAVIDGMVIGRPWRKVVWAAGGWAVVVAPLAVVARVVQTVGNVEAVAWWRRPMVAADAVVFYVWKLVWPATLSIDYARRPARVMGMWGGWWVVVAIVIVGVGAWWVWRGRGRRPWVAAGVLMAVAGVGPVLGLATFQFQYTSTVADHYLYLGMLGVAVGVSGVARGGLLGLRDGPPPLPSPGVPGEGVRGVPLGAVAVTVGVMALGVRSYLQVGHWRTDRGVWAHAVEGEAGSFVGRSNLAMSYGREAEGLAARGDGAGARACYGRAAELAEGAVAINPEFADARRRAATYGFAVGEDLRAVGHLEALIEMGERRAGVVKDLDEVRSWAAGAWAKLGEYERAAGHYEVLARTSKVYGEFARRELAGVRGKMVGDLGGD